MKEIDFLEHSNVETNSASRRLFSVGEKVTLQKLVLQYRIHSNLSIACRKVAWARLTEDFNSIKGFNRTETQLKKCWDNIKTRRKLSQARVSRPQAVGKQKTRSTDEEDYAADPLMPVKREDCVQDDDSDSISKDSEVAEVSLGSPASPPRRLNLADEEMPRPAAPTRTQESISNDRVQERIEELHKLKVAERVWTLKILRERHATAQLEREKAQLDRDRTQEEAEKAKLERERTQLELDKTREDTEKAKLEREKAKFERDIAECRKEKALLELGGRTSPEEQMQELYATNE